MKIRFKVEGNAKFYSFWISPDTSGKSNGYIAGGGKVFTCERDTVGKKAYE